MASYWEVLRVESGGPLLDDMQTYVSQPDAPGRHPAVVVIQEVFGVNRHIQAVADRLASAGYFAVAPVLFHREGTTEGIRGTNPLFSYSGPDADERAAAVANLKDDNIILDISTTIDWLNRHPRVNGEKIGIVGFCIGGRIAYLAAAACPGIGAASVFYAGLMFRSFGEVPSPFDRTMDIKSPVLGNFGEMDTTPTVEEVRKIEAELKRYSKSYDFKIYPGAGHGFYCDERSSYHESSAKDAWTRTLDWFQKHLAPVAASA